MLQVLRDCAEIAFCANPYVSFLWVHCRPRCQCRSEYSQRCKARAWPSGANVHRWVPRFLRRPCVYVWGVVTSTTTNVLAIQVVPLHLTVRASFQVKEKQHEGEESWMA